ncbi:phosphatidylserine synthase, putative [Plasmodium knowlesi strain H]|uniref:Phosphatidylserine synthase, putative n=3 Tax=Plasmodium knowlesi TaxID=5850 RepID=A0A5E7X4Q8_PLAKH|nr:phosphatidylserine synthase, putative [Plasmodium knowlesi strain H]OTN64436.1 putative Phosphatidylserine synthase [Plasmodium knowlesi]CAA9988874.1 phosphatidylserine synthase, putative [Plasmodium knowlesi strain H]SBO24709.1 phosphatidylserine synthase, putative [Plasmodium knowlesi strain H]SBO27983.1 phosphatidylserine synthase, putative [Plasmodium knowlesi strain H]VVS78348.1 phosphatidylserine synthase, putative [Plasmodium knowlesi strain H]
MLCTKMLSVYFFGASLLTTLFLAQRNDNWDYRTRLNIASLMALVNLLAVATLFKKYIYSVKRDIITIIVNALIMFYYPMILFLHFFTTSEVRSMIKYIFKNITFHAVEKSYMENCNSLENVMDKIDVYVIAHLGGWFLKTLAIRNFFVLNLNSVLFELIELRFQHILPNFYECWWDHIILDVLGCNLAGILIAFGVMKWLNMPLFSWNFPDKFKPNKKGIIFPTVDRLLRKVFTNSSSLVLLVFFSLMTNLNDLNIFFLKAELQLWQTNYLVFFREAVIVTIVFQGCIHLHRIISEPLNLKSLYYVITSSTILLLELSLAIRWKHNLVSDKSDLTTINMVWLSIGSTISSTLVLLYTNEFLI